MNRIATGEVVSSGCSMLALFLEDDYCVGCYHLLSLGWIRMIYIDIGQIIEKMYGYKLYGL